MKPYYEESGITIFNADCRDVLPDLPSGYLTVTDPPYGVDRKYGDKYNDSRAIYWDWFLPALELIKSKSSVLAMHHTLFSMKRITDWDWVIAWCKPFGAGARVGNSPILPHWEPILLWGIHSLGTKRECLPDVISCNPEPSPRVQPKRNPRNADKNTTSSGHPLPKPLTLEKKLIRLLWNDDAVLLDPFLGSGTTLRAAKDLGIQAIGIEIEEKYCEIAVNKLRQEVLFTR